jgi:excisionase family DNA binding protein
MDKKTLLMAILSLIQGSDLPASEKKHLIEAITDKPKPKRKLIKRREVLARLGVSAPTLLAMIRRGQLKEIRLSPRKIRFIESEVDALASGY